ncbi:glycosyltransferase family 2 protein [Aureisphaera galaxeae]|uniref:glycosyltransferase family 2 protein n=1 Tax=Aureisphaera galaxeae TaxID=1538023 RepID=UPI002350C2F3|nr:glycosyltransferase family 2 protein [Aureisphaera galaxeae]MDC8005065.1 glycosyltransferase family 2 protein [Aureisphaera galaxeae]
MPFVVKKKHTNTQPLVSIITPLYNAEAFIGQNIESVLNQTYENWEQIIVDDGSTDTSTSIVKAWAEKDARIKLILNAENKGAAYSRNHATELAKGNYIAFLDSDDWWHPSKLEKQIESMQEKGVAVSFTSYVHMDEQGNPLSKRIKALPELSYEKQHTNNYIGNLTGIYKCAEIGKIMAPPIRKRQDWAVWLEAIKKSGRPALGLQEDLAYYRVRKGSISSNKVNLVKYNYQFYRRYLNYNSLKSFLCMLRFFWEYFLVRPKQIETW